MTVHDELLNFAKPLDPVRGELADILALLERAGHSRNVSDRAAEADEAEARSRLAALVKELGEAGMAGHG